MGDSPSLGQFQNVGVFLLVSRVAVSMVAAVFEVVRVVDIPRLCNSPRVYSTLISSPSCPQDIKSSH